MDNYKKVLLNRATVTPVIVDYIENCIATEDGILTQSFHKIMVDNWQESLEQLFDLISNYFGSMFVPVNCTSKGDLTTFYTSNLNIVLKIIKFDFMFPHTRNMFNVNVVLNDKPANEFLGSMTTIENIVSGVVSKRFNGNCELDLSNFSKEPEFVSKKIWFYKLSLLSQFKILMLRMGRDTKKLILRNNMLSQAPADILNFFIKADLTAIDLSHNIIPSLQELYKVSSKTEKLWLEGNLLCEEMDPISYVKNVSMKFPRLIELDGVPLHQYGLTVPYFRNYLVTPNKKTVMVIEEFIGRYFSNFDHVVGNKRVKPFYEDTATLTISTDFSESLTQSLPHYGNFQRNMLDPIHKQKLSTKLNHRVYRNQNNIIGVYSKWPATIHDLTTFNVDVLCHNENMLLLVVGGIYKELVGPGNSAETIFQFRRTFMFNVYVKNNMSVYSIQHEMLNVTLANKEQIKNSFKTPIVNMNSLTPNNPTHEETEAISKAFQHITQLKKPEAELRLRYHSWNIQAALKDFTENLRDNKVPADRFVEDDDFSDGSSLLDEVY